MRRWPLLLALLAAPALAKMAWPDLLDRPQPKPDATIAYGRDPLQHVDLWRPAGAGPYPVVLMVHGGCWQTAIAKADIMNWIADDLRRRGIAVWNIEYRGVDRPGGGYPGTFQDVARAADLLAEAGARYRLRTDRVVALGHSAGGHLVLWLAARPGIARPSALAAAHPLRPAAVIGLGALPDLEAATVPPGDTCGAAPIHALVGAPSRAHPDVYADTSPARLPAPSAAVTLVNGSEDRIAPPAFAAAYARLHSVRRITVPGEGHVELIAPGTAAWAQTVALIAQALRPAH